MSHLKVFTVICLVLLAGLLLYVALIRVSLERAMRLLPHRHLEATAVIDRIYTYYRNHGRWPEKADVENGSTRWLPADWNYENADLPLGPCIWLPGEFHMAIIYRFVPPQDEQLSKTWSRGIEGKEDEFEAETIYAFARTAPHNEK